MRLRSLFVIGLTAMVMLMSAIPLPAETPKYFASDSLMGTTKFYYQGKHRRTYVCYCGDDFFVRMTYYDHDSGRWATPVRVDDVRRDDGHNTPRLLVTHDIFYGCHGDPIKYARSLHPEDISRWRLGKEISRGATYPHPVETRNGDIYVFYRGQTEGVNRPLRANRSTDGGTTWQEAINIVDVGADALGGVVRFGYHSFAYDATENRIYINFFHARGYTEPGKKWVPYAVVYDVTTKRVLTLDGIDLGPTATKDELEANGCRGWWAFARWGTDRVLTVAGIEQGNAWGLYTPDGLNVTGFFTHGTSTTKRPFPAYEDDFPLHDLTVRTSPDGGKTWDDGKIVLAHDALEDIPYGPQLVFGYSGSGPFLIFQGVGEHATEDFLLRYRMRHKYHILPILLPRFPGRRAPWHVSWDCWNNYNRPLRTRQRLYALDSDYEFVANTE